MSAKSFKLLNGNLIPAIGLGTYDIPNKLTAEVVYNGLKIGYRHFDTAVLYGNEAEVAEGISRWLNEGPQNTRADVFYTTKLWNLQQGYTATKRAVQEMLAKAKPLGYIDLMLIHSPLPGKEMRLETWRALQEEVQKGTIKNIGVSNYGKHHITELLSWEGLKVQPVINQIEISPWCMRQELADFCKSQGLIVEAYAPLTHGYKLLHPPQELSEIAQKYDVTVAQVLIKWSMQKGYLPLPKTKTLSRLRENLEIEHFNLTQKEIEAISRPNEHDPTDWECTDAP